MILRPAFILLVSLSRWAKAAPLVSATESPSPLLLAPGGQPTPISTSTSRAMSSLTAIDGPATSTIFGPVTSTVIVTSPPQVVTVHAKPKTEIVTVSVLPSVVQASPTQISWSPPPHYSNLACFNITKFACGQNNIQLKDANENASATSDPTINTSSSSSRTALQLFYPNASINPGNSDAPQGGVDFYASPLDLSTRRNVTMAYDVFFPDNFQWVKGGKLPGLYGGRPGCSGGDAAEDCFSTRLMWRAGGAGELYLYAPKTKQGPTVCSTPPKCDCNAAYGLSIGRGSFNFTPGGWTTVRQTVYLNTPGLQDGTFALDVNGARVMDVSGVYYREGAPVQSEGIEGLIIKDVDTIVPLTNRGQRPILQTLSSPVELGPPEGAMVAEQGALAGAAAWDGLLGDSPSANAGVRPLMPGVVGDNEDQDIEAAGLEEPLIEDILAAAGPKAGIPLLFIGPNEGAMKVVTVTKPIHVHTVVLPALLPDVTRTVLPTPTALAESEESKKKGNKAGTTTTNPVGFVGIFFSTFFGGHDVSFASPSDQKTWFKKFSLTINDV